MSNRAKRTKYSKFSIALLAVIGFQDGFGMFNEAHAQESLLKANMSTTSLGSSPMLSGVPADYFAWQVTDSKVLVNASGDLIVSAKDLLITNTDGMAPGLENTDGGSDFFASLACGGSVVANSAATFPGTNGKIKIEEFNFLTYAGVNDCPGAQILLRLNMGSPTTGPNQMYAVAGGGQSTGGGDGRLFVLEAGDNLSELADLSTTRGLSGLAFDSHSRLFVTTNRLGSTGTTSGFHQVDPDTGDILSTTELAAVVRDLAFQPGTDVLYGITGGFGGNSTGTLVTIDTASGALNVVKDDGPSWTGGGLAFAPDGTLYRGAATLPSSPVGRGLQTLDPVTGDILTHVQTDYVTENLFLDGLGVTPEGLIVGTHARSNRIFLVDPNTGDLTLVFNFGELISDVDFRLSPWVAASGFAIP